jgi:hypothetical protein
MRHLFQARPWMWLVAGLAVGWLAGGFWPSTPLHAVATDRAENLIMATGLVDAELEGIFLLDAQTGMLRGGVPFWRQGGGFQAAWAANPIADLATVVAQVNTTIRAENATRKGGAIVPEIQIPQSPKFTMVTGLIDIRQGPSRSRPGRTIVYVAEANTGVVLGYALPWNANAHAANQAFRQPMLLWTADKLATAIVPTEE